MQRSSDRRHTSQTLDTGVDKRHQELAKAIPLIGSQRQHHPQRSRGQTPQSPVLSLGNRTAEREAVQMTGAISVRAPFTLSVGT